MRLFDVVFDVLRRAGEPLSPAEIVRHIKSARIPLDANESLNDETLMVELEHVAADSSETPGIVRTPSGRFTLPSMLDRTIRSGTSLAASTASTINPIGIASAIARANVGAVWTVRDATKQALHRAKRPLSISEMATTLRAAGILKGTRSKDEAEVRSQLIQDMLQNGRESTFVRLGNNTYALRYHSTESAFPDGVDREFTAIGPSAIESASSENAESNADESQRLTGAVLRSNVATPSRLARDIADSPTSVQTEEDDHALLRRIRTLTNQRFERFIVVFLASIGLTDIEVINRLRPGELDIHAGISVADVSNIKFSVQALNWHRDVHGGDVQLLRGGMRIGDHGLIITTGEIQRGALDEANRKDAIPIATINGEQLIKIARERGAAKVLG